MKSLLILFTIVIVVQTFGHKKVRYDNYRVYRIVPRSGEDLEFLQNLEEESPDFNFWTRVRGVGHNVDVMIPPHTFENFERILEVQNFESKILIPNVQKLIDEEKGEAKTSLDFGWADYNTIEEINSWLSSLAEEYPDTVTVLKGGTSYEGRDIVGVRVSFNSGNENRSVFVEGNIHACEWITSAVVTYMLNELLTSTHPDVRQVAESRDWYIFPVINPDGFAYSHNTDRMWRKTRVPYTDNCTGADPNRNWAYHYNEGGVSDDPCSNSFRGAEAFSEPSMKSLSEFISTIGNSLQAYIAFHSYAQVLLIPYGYTAKHLDNYDELFEVGSKAIDSLAQRYGTQYKVGVIPDLMYIASGNSPDWVKGTFGTRITYAYELRDTGDYGFILPPQQIIPTAKETFDSFITIFQEFDKLG